MSRTEWVAQIDPNGSPALYFSQARLVSGRWSPRKRWDVEELRAPGVNGSRWRRIAKHAPLLHFLAVEPVPSGGDVGDMIASYDDAVGNLAWVRIALPDLRLTYKDAMVVGWHQVGIGANLVGFGSITGSTHTLLSRWILSTPRDV